MSAETKDAVEAAIRSHIADEKDGALTASWVVVSEFLPEEDDGDTHMLDIIPDSQSAAASIGLLTYAAHHRVCRC